VNSIPTELEYVPGSSTVPNVGVDKSIPIAVLIIAADLFPELS